MFYESVTYRENLNNALHAICNNRDLYGKRFLISGASGLIGSFIIDMLAFANEVEDAGIEIWALGRDESKLRERFHSNISSGHLNFIIQDITDKFVCDIEYDYIINLAGDGYPAAFRERPVETMTPAFVGTYNLLEHVVKTGKGRVLLASTGEVYGTIENRQAFVENDCGYIDSMSSRSCYPIAKKAAETLCASYAKEYDVYVMVARLSHVYGANSSPKDNRATVQFMQNAIKKEDIVLHSLGNQMRSYTYVADAVVGLFYILLRGNKGEAYNVANAESRITIADFAKETAKIGGVKCVRKMEDDIARAEKTPIEYAVLDSSKLEKLGYKAEYTPSEGIRDSLKILEEISKR